MTPARPAWLGRLLGDPGAVSFARFRPVVRAAAASAERVEGLSDAELREGLRGVRLGTGAPSRRSTETAETARFLSLAGEAARRTLRMRPFDEQLLACCALLAGHAVEMDTGEGKTLVGAMAAVGYAMSGRRVHVLSVNDYLAERDAGWMGPLFDFLGVRVAWVGAGSTAAERREAYRCDVVYAPVSEVGFDLLRDRFALTSRERVGPVLDAVIVDEADAVMIDEAMVPLVLAGSSADVADDFAQATSLVDGLTRQDFTVDGDGATVALTESGLDAVEARLDDINLYDAENAATLTRINLALHARLLVHRDVDYLVTEDGIKLVNAARGRIAHLQRWPDGLHAALESKEGLSISAPGIVLDTITVQDLLMRYGTRSGMSGTVLPVAEELLEFYRLPAGRVERHEPNRRIDATDVVVSTTTEKARAIVDDTVRRHRAGQPVLLGTQSVAESEELAELLAAAGIEAQVLNARNDADEARIVSQAGAYGSVTISTQMSGRGTDIRLGGPDGSDRDRVLATGGLAVIAAGRYPSRRLDAQLRGRAGRQGDPGSSRAFVSLEDELVRRHATDAMLAKIDRGDVPVTKRGELVDTCQQIAEGMRRDRHRATWEYSRAIAMQRDSVLAHRETVMDGAGVPDPLRERSGPVIGELESICGRTDVARIAREIVLHFLDDRWTDHLAYLQELRDGIHLRALAGQRPADEFHRLALAQFQGFYDDVYRDAAEVVSRLSPDDLGRRLEDLGLHRPSSTWTYMVTDDPLGSPGDRFAHRIGKAFRSKVLGIE